MIFEMLGGLPTFRGKDLRQTYQKVLYADVVFSPEENFSPNARELLLGLIHRWESSLSDFSLLIRNINLLHFDRCREPSKRLGSSKRRDIKAATFFKDVNWDDIYARKNDGPWVPDPSHVYAQKKKKKKEEDEGS